MKNVLIVGCGDVAQRALPWLTRRFRVLALARGPESAAALRARGVTPVPGDLDSLRSLRRLAGIADVVLHSAPPPDQGYDDPRTRNLLAALGGGESLARRLVYISTSGVYGDCGGGRVSEASPLRAATARARRRVAAERRLRSFAVRNGLQLAILRAPGIYAAERLSLERLKRGDPVLQQTDDVYTNHIHADDLAHALTRAIVRGQGGRAYNINDDAVLKMGDYYDGMADVFGLARPPRMSREECAQRLSPMMMTFMSESRRLDNARMKKELRLRLQWPQVLVGLQAIRDQRISNPHNPDR
ncbi:NAD-dependent epimerase/dehydratase family protein [Uliginosibacterium sp. H3]|uniref:NAD-dependent epimerase/dehydratase family protein n=1 Tax=Uliginosibacterium silvisoli TaxID=3114758 RepID=A0ABU6K347_9RHOO|nr:NAD-dependent epimerase/dehydratase family protein [Uliginosibacterium sp. H3]